ncbi:MAG TPA: GAF domain-containing protein [Povalibacter sp.]|nr:GAF domain-containing protein [Povalibacter sp.]
MHESGISTDLPKAELYGQLVQELRSLITGEPDLIANLANASALLFHSLPDLNWAGFYLLRKGELVVGPFQGKPACVRIAMGKGVCGTSAARRATVVVPNVHEFPGHIACDSASNSEIVVPLIRGQELLGVLDIDSPKFERFDAEDQKGLEAAVAALMQALPVV